MWFDFWNFGKGGGLPAKGLGAKRLSSNAVIGPKFSIRLEDGFGWGSVSGIWGRGGGAAKGLDAKRVV